MNKILLNILILVHIFSFSCNESSKKQNTEIHINTPTVLIDTTIVADSTEKVEVVLDLELPISQQRLNTFNKKADSIIRYALNKKNIRYKIKTDTIGKSKLNVIYLEFFSTPSLIQTIEYKLRLPSPDKHYSFKFVSFEYKDAITADKITKDVCTFSCLTQLGIMKYQEYIIRYKNYVFWLYAPHSLSKYTYNKIRLAFIKIFENKNIDTIDNNCIYSHTIDIKKEGILGSWQIKPFAPVYKNDTTKIQDFTNLVLHITDSSFIIDQIEFPIKKVRNTIFPDIQSYFINRKRMYRRSSELNPVIKKFTGSLTQYFVTFHQIADNHYLLNSEYPWKFIKISENQLGFIKAGKLYLMERMK